MEEFKVHKVGGIGGHTLKKLGNPCLEFERCQFWGIKCSGEHQNGQGVVRGNETAWGETCLFPQRAREFFPKPAKESSHQQGPALHFSPFALTAVLHAFSKAPKLQDLGSAHWASHTEPHRSDWDKHRHEWTRAPVKCPSITNWHTGGNLGYCLKRVCGQWILSRKNTYKFANEFGLFFSLPFSQLVPLLRGYN